MAEQANNPQVNWNDDSMATTYANVCNVAFTQEEVVLLFGMNQNWHGGQDEITIKLAKRMIMSPHGARRLQALLGNLLAQYESRFGPLGMDAGAPASA
ncbi:MAG: DUF3467 domain-containing protein [Planctomycetes bacterium]|nr:DUF3467 domain-containing protein [Planctomycetota bacterium]